MQSASSGSGGTLLFIGLVLIVSIALVVYLRRRGRSPKSGTRPSPAVQPGASWAPPSYAAAQISPRGPSLKVSVHLVQIDNDRLLVTWNATNDGTAPLQIQWGAPIVKADSGVLRLLYTCPTDAVFEPPAGRLLQPGEIVSRSASVAKTVVGPEVADFQVSVTVGYGAVERYPSAPVSREAYLQWQQVAVSQGRAVR